MRSSLPTAFFLLAGCVQALPAPAPQASMGGSSPSQAASPIDPSGIINLPLPPHASGSLRGSEALLGYNPANPVLTKSTVIPPSDFELAPGQSEDANIGLYIDLTNVKNPQPIRGGTEGPTEPGPRYVHVPIFGVTQVLTKLLVLRHMTD
jgi:hypothetical protein